MRAPALLSLVLLTAFTTAAAQQPRRLVLSQLTWYDRAGSKLGTIGPLADHGNIEVSPGGTEIASSVSDRATGARDLWIYPTSGTAPRQLTSSTADENWMIWSADGSRAVHNAFAPGALDLFELPTGSTGARRRLAPDESARWPVSLSPDGRFLLYVTNDADTGNDIWVLPMTGTGRAYPFQRTAAAENWATFSPDGRFVAFSSAESGASEVFVTPFPGPGPTWRVSSEIGSQTRWRTPEELIFIDGDRRLRAVSLRVANGVVSARGEQTLFEIAYAYAAYHAFDITKDGRRILVNTAIVSGREPSSVAMARPDKSWFRGTGLAKLYHRAAAARLPRTTLRASSRTDRGVVAVR